MYSRRSEAITRARRIPLMLAALTAASALLATPAARAAFLPLPASGAQVNDDPANSIDPSQDAGVSDVAGGAVTAGKVQVPWATFEQKVAGGEQQIFVRAFKNGAWVTQGFPASLNIDPTEEAEAPSIDFAGAGRTVPWVAWYEPSAAAGWPTNIFASRFNAAANVWLPSGQGRGPLHLPSLNIHTLRTAENPSVAGGAAVAGNDPVPWVTWEENDGVPNDDTTLRQIFVAKALKQAVPGTACPVGTKPTGGIDVNGFCWQQVGLDRLNPSGPTPVRQRRSHAQHRPDPLGRRAGHRVHRSERHRRVGRLVRGGSHPDRRAPQQRHGLRGQDRRGRHGRRWLPLARGRERNGRPDQRPRHLGRARLRQLRRERRRRGRVHAQRGRPPRRGEPARRRRHAHAGRRDRAVGRLAGGPGRRQARRLRLAAGRRRPLRALQLRPAGLEHGERRDATRHHVLRQRAVHLLAGGRVRRRR